jgi:hypothetical protein
MISILDGSPFDVSHRARALKASRHQPRGFFYTDTRHRSRWP